MIRHMIFGLAVLGSGCFYSLERARLLEQRVDGLAAENQALRRELLETQKALSSTTGQLEKAIEGFEKMARRGDADMGVQMQRTLEDMAALRGQVETYQFRIGELESALRRATEGVERRTEAPNDGGRTDTLKRPDDPREFLKLAEEKLGGEDKTLGRTLLGEYLKRWPKNEGAARAHFLLGEAQYSSQAWREAMYEFSKVMQDFPKARETPVAYLRAAQCLHKLKLLPDAKLALEELLRQFPKSDAAKEGRALLTELSREPAKGKPPAGKQPAKKPASKP